MNLKEIKEGGIWEGLQGEKGRGKDNLKNIIYLWNAEDSFRVLAMPEKYLTTERSPISLFTF